jgi:nucleotide-binding universal stress UspA family protein
MTYKTLLVHIDDSRRSDARVEFALDLARKYDAHLIGLYVVCQDLLRPLFKRDESLRLAVNEAQSVARQQRAHEHFVAAAERAGCRFEWRAPPGPALDAATLHARHADLTIFGQYDPQDDASYIARNFLEDLVMSAGRPMLVLPHAGRIGSCGENVLIAWDGSREAARAVADAMPTLERARFVTVETVQKHKDDDEPIGIDVAAYLKRHGVKAGFSSTPRAGGLNTGGTLLNRLTDLHADLLVMGAYGHARAQEWVLGGVTRTMLETMTVPVLMSH